MKLGNYWHPTPKKWRLWGDSILAVSGFVTGGGLLAFEQLETIFSKGEVKAIIGTFFVAGVAGKFLTNFFKDDATTTPNDKP